MSSSQHYGSKWGHFRLAHSFGVGPVAVACLKAGVQFSVVLTKNRAVTRAIGTIPEDAWGPPVHYPGAVVDPETGELISDAEVAETTFTAFASTEHPVTARLVVRRVRDQNKLEELYPVWRYHPFFTNSDEPTVEADLTHRRHAVIETVFADLIDGPLAHLPSGRFAANGAWAVCAMITHNLLRATDTLGASSDQPAVARGATLRRQIVRVPARLARPQRRPVLRLPAHRQSPDARDNLVRLWRHTIGELIRRLLPRRRPRANPRVVKRKYTKWHVQRARHQQWPQPDRPPEEAVII